MEIKGLDYNTSREKLLMTEYGRNVQKMVEAAIELPTRHQRQVAAKAIVETMENRNPLLKRNADYRHTLWDHLYVISQGRLDIEWPYQVDTDNSRNTKPQPLRIPSGRIGMRHYGRLVEQLLSKIKDMPEGPRRNELVRRTANQMKRDLMNWGHGSMENERVVNDLSAMTDGAVTLDLTVFRFEKIRTKAFTPKPNVRKGRKKRK